MGFIDAMKETYLRSDLNTSVTENGALGYKTTGKYLLDMNFATTSLRKSSEDKINKMFMNVFLEDKLLALKWLFYVRDIRQGVGERRLFKVIVNYLATEETEIVKSLIPLIGEYGRYDDLFSLVGTPCEDEMFSFIRKQLTEDMENMKNGKSISLLAKWMPSLTASSYKTKDLATIVRRGLSISEKEYRKMLSTLREYLNVVERKISDNNWGDVNYEAVPSKANLKYKNAFLNHDCDRRKEFIKSVERGEMKINSATNFPHDIVREYTKNGYSEYHFTKEDKTVEEMWKSLPNIVNGESNTLFIRDGSGSMLDRCDPKNSDVRALDVSTALAIYFAERSSGAFKDKFITFSARPKIIDIGNLKTLRDKIIRCLYEDDYTYTNIEGTFNLILRTAVENNMTQDELPKNILICSDMEFDEVEEHTRCDKTLFESIEEKFNDYGYKMPRLIFWNVCSRTKTIPVISNDLGVALVSGFSPNTMKMALNGELDPYKCLTSELSKERYMPIEEAVKGLL